MKFKQYAVDGILYYIREQDYVKHLGPVGLLGASYVALDIERNELLKCKIDLQAVLSKGMGE